MAAKKRTKKAPKKQTSAEKRQKKISEMMEVARRMRQEHKHLIQDIRTDMELRAKVKQRLIDDLRRVWDIPRHILGQSASRRRYREQGFFSEELVTMLFGQWVEFQRAAEIPMQDTRGVMTVKRKISDTLRAQKVMAYAEEHVKPWDGAYDTLDMEQEEVILQVGGDWHSKFACPFAHRVWGEVRDWVKPDGIRYNGDGPDFPKISRHRQLPGHFVLNLQQEINIWKGIMAEDRAALPDVDLKWLLGNHCIRLVNYLADVAPHLGYLDSNKYHELFKLDENEIGLIARCSFLNPSREMRNKDISQNWETLNDAEGRPFWTTVHGWLLGKDAPEKHMKRFMTFGINNHLHDPKSVAGGSLATGALRWWQAGCMSWPRALAAGYLPGPIEAHGWFTTFYIVHLYPWARHVSVEEVHVGENIATFRDYYWEITPEEIAQREEMMEV
jgi:hypothetical protein